MAGNNWGRFQYTGQAWLADLGMYYYKARMYSPTLARFLQTDPIGYKDQVNLYDYANDDPVDGRDPSGNNALATFAPEALEFCIGPQAAVCAGVALAGLGAYECYLHCGAIFNNEVTAPRPQKPEVDGDKQGKHQPGHKNFDPARGGSELDHPNPQGLIDDHAGTGDQKGSTPIGEPGSKENIDFGERIGTHVDQQGNRQETTRGTVHYDSKGKVHIVPARPNPSPQALDIQSKS